MKNVYIKPITLLVAATLVIFSLQAQTGKATTSQVQVNPQALNFILMGDWGRVGADHQKEVATQMGKTAETADVDFVITTGDNFYPEGVVSEFDPLWRYSFEEIYTAFSLQRDWHPVLGNHDYGSNPDAEVAYSKISRRWRMPARYYTEVFNLGGDTTQQALFVLIDNTPLFKGDYKGDCHKVHDQVSTAQV